jgi:excisionase family DNA binding protein
MKPAKQPAAAVVVAPIDLRRNPPRLLNFGELCVLLDISERHARHLIAERKLPAIRLGKCLLFDTQRILVALDKLSA